MKRKTTFLLLPIVAAALVIAMYLPAQAGTDSDTDVIAVTKDDSNIDYAPSGYVLKWSDEFSGGPELSSDWSYEEVGPGWVNHEKQRYIKDERNGVRTAEVSNGTLKITALKIDGEVCSARVYAKKATGWQYGYFAARIKLPKGKGAWPAWWMMPVKGEGGWPRCGEIDIMEEVGFNPGDVHSTIHCEAYNHTKGTQRGASRYVADSEDAFHVYSLEWTPDRIVSYIDGEQLLVFANDQTGNHSTWPYHYAFYPILNLAWGGDWGGQQGVDDSALPAQMEVDWVRVYQCRSQLE